MSAHGSNNVRRREATAELSVLQRLSTHDTVPWIYVWWQGVTGLRVRGRHWKMCERGGDDGWLEEEARWGLLLPPARPSNKVRARPPDSPATHPPSRAANTLFTSQLFSYCYPEAIRLEFSTTSRPGCALAGGEGGRA